MQVWLYWASVALWVAFILYWSANPGAAAAPAEAEATGDSTGAPARRRPWISVRFVRTTAPARDKTTPQVTGAPEATGASPGAGAAPTASAAPDDAAAPSSAASAPSRESGASRTAHQLLMWGAILFCLLPGFPPLDRRFLPDPSFVPLGGIALQLVSAALYIWSRRHLGRYWSGMVMTRRDHALIRTGPYRLLRHPMYTAIIGMFVGTALVSGQFHALLGLAIGAIAYWRKIRVEERHLATVFGEQYAAYQRDTWALVPGVL